MSTSILNPGPARLDERTIMLQQSRSLSQDPAPSSGPADSLVTATAMALDGASESTTRQILDFVEDLDQAMRFMTRWSLGSLLGLDPGEHVDRWGITLRLSERAERDAAFRREFLCHPRYVSALAVDEGLDIKPIYFLWQVKNVGLLEEAPGLHWLVLPACHRGCAMLDGEGARPSTGSCQACGKPLGPASERVRETMPAATPASRIHAVDEFIIRAAQADAATRARLLADPTSVFAQAAQEVFGVRTREAFGIREVRVAEDTDTALYFVLLARHESANSAPNSPR